jgi:hypothetical protein
VLDGAADDRNLADRRMRERDVLELGRGGPKPLYFCA